MLDRIMLLLEAPRKPKGPGTPTIRRSKAHQKQQMRQAKKRSKIKKRSADTVAKKVASQAKAKNTREKKSKAAMRAALALNKKARQQRKATAKATKQEPAGSAGKSTSASPSGKSPSSMVSAQVRHCMLALKHKGGKSEKAAWNICRWSLTKHGYLKGPYRVNTKLPKAIRNTGKGQRRTMQHAMEKGPLNGGIPGTGTTKARKFNKMFKKIEKDLMPKSRR